jgi:uncharacterized protein YebE (UPF0316 family)
MSLPSPDLTMIITGIIIFFARIVDVTMGTMRTISIIQGRTWMAFWLGFVEIGVWLSVISTVIYKIKDEPLLGIFYAFGFATGNLVGIHIEKKLAFGHIIIRVISRVHPLEMTEKIRRAGFAVTTFTGQGMAGPVVELYIVCRRKRVKEILGLVRAVEPDAFYVLEQVGAVNKILNPIMQPVSGWRSIFKKK